MHPQWTTKDVEILKASLAAGKFVPDIRAALDNKFALQTIKKQIKKQGLKCVRPRTEWTEAEDEILRKGIAEGLTASEVGRRVKKTRNSAIGRASRLHLHFGAGLNGQASERHHQTTRANQIRARQTRIVTPKRLRPADPENLPEPEFKGPLGTFPNDSASTPSLCRAIKGEPTAIDWQCCANPVKLGHSYCETHWAKFTQPIADRGQVFPHLVVKGVAGRVLR